MCAPHISGNFCVPLTPQSDVRPNIKPMTGAIRVQQGYFHRLLAAGYLLGGAAVLVQAIIDGRTHTEPPFDIQLGLFTRYVAAGALCYLGFELARVNLRGVLLGILLLLFSLIVHVGYIVVLGEANWAALAGHATAYVAAMLYVRSTAFQRLLA